MTRPPVSPWMLPYEYRAHNSLVSAGQSPGHRMTPTGKRWCEHGQHYAPRVGLAVKGWKCRECAK